MECKNCGAKWEVKKEVSESLAKCPFCGKPLATTAQPLFYDNSKDALAAIMRQFGADVLLGKLTAHFPDFAPTVAAGDKRLVYAVYELGAAQVLKSNLNATQADKEIAVKVAVSKLTESHIALDSAESIVREFAAALGWQISKPSPQPTTTAPTATPPPTPPISSPQPPPAPPKRWPSAPPAPTPATASPTSDIATKIKRGETRNLQFGDHKWRVLEASGNRALLLTEDIIERRRYNIAWKDVTWETCTLRQYLNGEFLRKFKNDEQRLIAETRVANPNNLWFYTIGGNDTYDKVFLLSLDEADRYFGNSGDYVDKRRKEYKDGKYIASSDGYWLSNEHDSKRVTKEKNGRAWWWWLRSPGHFSSIAAIVYTDGRVGVSGFGVNFAYGGVRPALWLNL